MKNLYVFLFGCFLIIAYRLDMIYISISNIENKEQDNYYAVGIRECNVSTMDFMNWDIEVDSSNLERVEWVECNVNYNRKYTVQDIIVYEVIGDYSYLVEIYRALTNIRSILI